MKFTDKKFEELFYIYANGKGRDAEIHLRFRGYCDDILSINIHIEDAKAMSFLLLKAIEKAEINSKMEDDE